MHILVHIDATVGMLLEDLLLIAEKAPKCKTWNYCNGFGFTGIVRDDETLLMVAADDEAKLTVNQLIKELSQYDPAQKVVLTEEYMWENFEKQDGHYFTYDEKLKSCCYEHICTDVRVPTEEQFAAYSKLEYVDLGLPVKWATCNLGASAPEEYGDYFAWGELKPKNKYTTDNYRFGSGVPFKKYQSDTKVVVKHLFRANETKTVGDNKSVLDAEDDAAAVQLGGKWHIPTPRDFRQLIDCCTWTWTSIHDVTGYIVQSEKKGYKDRWIFLPACGFKIDKHPAVDTQSGASYLTASLKKGGSDFAITLQFPHTASAGFWRRDTDPCFISQSVRYSGHAIRPVMG